MRRQRTRSMNERWALSMADRSISRRVVRRAAVTRWRGVVLRSISGRTDSSTHTAVIKLRPLPYRARTDGRDITPDAT